MVNTFLVCFDFKKSAAILDYKRLGKQRVEAQQVLNLLLQIRYIADELKLSYPTTSIEWKSFVKTIKTATKENTWIWSSKNKNACIYDDKLNIDDYKVVKLGFCHHPLLMMWWNYEDALKYYINCHIEEWIKRGYKNNMQIHELPDNIDLPWWTADDKFHKCHQAALLSKDQNYYSKYFDDIEFNEYWWPSIFD